MNKGASSYSPDHTPSNISITTALFSRHLRNAPPFPSEGASNMTTHEPINAPRSNLSSIAPSRASTITTITTISSLPPAPPSTPHHRHRHPPPAAHHRRRHQYHYHTTTFMMCIGGPALASTDDALSLSSRQWTKQVEFPIMHGDIKTVARVLHDRP